MKQDHTDERNDLMLEKLKIINRYLPAQEKESLEIKKLYSEIESISSKYREDENVIDGTVRAIAWSALATSVALKKIQNGYVRSYALAMVVGALLLVATIWVVTL